MNPFLDKAFEPHYQESPLTLLDVGARGGIHDRWKPCMRHLQVIGFEPDDHAFQELENQISKPGSNKYLNVALADSTGEWDFHNIRSPGCSSLLKPNSEFLSDFPDAARWDVLSSSKIKVTSLDRALSEAKVEDADFIKLDTQGTELSVLQGGVETLTQSIFGVEVEVEFAEIYEGQPLFPDVDKYLRSLGFVLFDMRAIYWKRESAKGVGGRKGQMVFADALYFKSIKKFLNDGACQKSKLLKALTICVVYGYFDYALALCGQGKNLKILDEQECELATEHLKKPRHLSALWPWFRGRDRLANVLYHIYDIFRSHDWSHAGSSGRYLGNTGDTLFRG